MNEPFLPLPLPAPPEHGFGRVLAGLVRSLRSRIRRRRSDARLGPAGAARTCRVRFPTLPPVEF